MEEWKTVKLGEVLNFRRGHDLPHDQMQKGDVPVAGSNGIIGYHNLATPISPILTIGRSGNIGTPFLYEKAWAHNTTLYVDDFKGNEPKFLYYLCKTLPFTSFKGGSAVPTLNRNHIHPLEVSIPVNIATQRRIAAILSSLDDQIENNNRINRNLEAQAQALFKSWFVDFEPWGGTMPDGWREGTLGELANIIMGQSPSGKTLNEEGLGTIFYQGCKDFGDRFPSIRVYSTGPTRYAEINSVLMSVRAPVGDINVALVPCSIGRGLASIKAKGNYQSYILYMLKTQKKVLDTYNSEGSVFGCINKKSIEGLPILCPPMEILTEYENIVSQIDNKIRCAHLQNDRLATLRDTLLPKLMSGEIEV